MPSSGYQSFTTIEQYYLDNGVATGIIKANDPLDPDYVPDVYNIIACPLTLPDSPTPTPTKTPTPTPTPTPSISPCKTWRAAIKGNDYILSYNDCNGDPVIKELLDGAVYDFCTIDSLPKSDGPATFSILNNDKCIPPVCNTYAYIGTGKDTSIINYTDCDWYPQQATVYTQQVTYICSWDSQITPGNYGAYIINQVSLGCNIAPSGTPSPTPTVTPTITPSISVSPASGGTPIVTNFDTQLFSCIGTNDYAGYYVELDRITPVNVYYQLRITFNDTNTGLVSFNQNVFGYIPAGSWRDESNLNPCDGTGGINLGGQNVYPSTVCIVAIDNTVINPLCLCSGCPSPSATPSITPSNTPSSTPSITASPVSPSITPTITVTPTRTPTVTPSITTTPSITNTPTITPTPSVTLAYDSYLADVYKCDVGCATKWLEDVTVYFTRGSIINIGGFYVSSTGPNAVSYIYELQNSTGPSSTDSSGPVLVNTDYGSCTTACLNLPSPSVTPTISSTPSITPTITPSETPSVTITPSETPSVTITPTITSTITPTPTVTPSPLTGYFYVANRYDCNGGCAYASQQIIYNPTVDFVLGKYYLHQLSPGYYVTYNPQSSTTAQGAILVDSSAGNRYNTCALGCAAVPSPSVTPTPTITPTPSS